jgi:biopolymer transport protein ExbB/TolQ
VEEIRDSRVCSLELQYLVKWKGFPDKESSWEPVAHLGNNMEFVEEFHQANPTKLSQATLERALQEAAKKEARKKARAEAARQAQEARKRKAKEALAGRPKRRSERLQSRIESESQ